MPDGKCVMDQNITDLQKRRAENIIKHAFAFKTDKSVLLFRFRLFFSS